MTAATHRHATISPGLNRVRPAAIAANGTIEVCAAKDCQPGPSARRRLASIDTVPASAAPKTLSVTRILAVVRVGECGRFAFVSPDLFPGSLGMLQEIGIPIFKVSVDCRLRGIHRLIITVVDDRTCHAAEDRFDHVQELSTG